MKYSENLKKKKESCVHLLLTPSTCEQLGLYMQLCLMWKYWSGPNGIHPSSGVTHMLKIKIVSAYIISVGTLHRGKF